MTENLLPVALRNLPAPWNLTSDAARAAALAGGSAEAPAVLERVLDVLPSLLAAEPDDEDVPAELGYYFDFTAIKLAEAIPVLDSVSETTLRDVLRGWTDEGAGRSAAVLLGRRWLALLARHLVTDAAAATPAPELAAVLGRQLRRLDPGTAASLLAGVGARREPAVLALLESVGRDDTLDATVRDQARRMLVAADEP